MAYYNRNYRIFGLYSSSGILKPLQNMLLKQPVSETSCTLVFLESQMIDKVQKPRHSEWKDIAALPPKSRDPPAACWTALLYITVRICNEDREWRSKTRAINVMGVTDIDPTETNSFVWARRLPTSWNNCTIHWSMVARKSTPSKVILPPV
jgi:hypothetical protein